MTPHAGLPRAFDLTRLGYFLDFALVPLAALALVGFAWTCGLGIGWIMLALLAGLLVWSLAEYWIHRAIFHGDTPFAPMHEMHHALPKDWIGVASWGTLTAFAGVWLVAQTITGASIGSAITAGVMVGYLFYCAIHVAMHHNGARGFGRYGQLMRALHQGHHRGGRGNFGVSSPVWDIVFRTFHPSLQRKASP